jgi:hypothetical protein
MTFISTGIRLYPEQMSLKRGSTDVHAVRQPGILLFRHFYARETAPTHAIVNFFSPAYLPSHNTQVRPYKVFPCRKRICIEILDTVRQFVITGFCDIWRLRIPGYQLGIVIIQKRSRFLCFMPSVSYKYCSVITDSVKRGQVMH